MTTANEMDGAQMAGYPTDNDGALYRKVMWRIIPVLMICYTIAYIDRVNVSFAKLQMGSELELSDTVYGLGAGIFFIGYLLAEVPSNLMLYRFGARRWFARILVTWGILSAAMMFTTSATSFYVIRFFLGVAEAGFFPGVIYYLSLWFPAANRSRATSLFYLGAPIAGLIGGPLSGYLLDNMHNVQGLSGWQWMFLIEAIPAVVMGVFVFLYLDDKIIDAKWLNDTEKEYLLSRLALENNSKANLSLRQVVVNNYVWLFGATLFLYVLGQNAIFFWLPSILRDSGIQQPSLIGWLTAIPYGFSILAVLIIGRLADLRDHRRAYLICSCLLGSVAFLSTTLFSGNTVLVMVGLTVAVTCGMVMLPLFFTFPSAVFKGRSAAGAIALINSVGVAAGFVGPYAIGALRDATGHPESGMYLLAFCWSLAAVLTSFFPGRGKMQNT